MVTWLCIHFHLPRIPFPSPFSLSVSWDLKRLSCREHVYIYGSYFCVHSSTICFLIEAFSYFSSVQSLSRVQLFATSWIVARQASLSITNTQSSPKPMSLVSMMPSNHLILCHPLLLLPPSFPALGSFQMSQLFPSGGQSISISASISVLPMNTQDWSPLGWTGWISICSDFGAQKNKVSHFFPCFPTYLP